MKAKKLLSIALASMLAIASLTGCGEKKDDKISITIGNAPVEGQSGYDNYMKRINEFKADHQDWNVESSSFTYDVKNFMVKAAANQLPTTWSTFFTEIKTISEAGYCADISKNLKETGLDKILNPEIMKVVTGGNGEIWGLPTDAYAQGLHINKRLFKEAGLVNADGTVKAPQTYDELAEYAKTIKEKTGVAGFAIPSTSNCGGWHLMNIAWSYGTEFMKQDSNGKWTATFDSDEFKTAVKWLYDLKWKYNAVPEDAALDQAGLFKTFGSGQAAMMIANPPINDLTTKYDMQIEDIACVSMPAGPKGRYAQTGGNLIMFNANASDEEINAALAWYIEQGGFDSKITDESLKKSEENYNAQLEAGRIILPSSSAAMQVCINREGEEKLKALQDQYSNVDAKDYNDYFDFGKVQLKAEEPVCCQELYAVLDNIVQEVLVNKDADIDALVKTAASDFQKNSLDNIK